MLFDPCAHEPLVETPWDPNRAEDEIRAIARDADDALRSDNGWWPVHPSDAEPDDPDTFHGIYLGAAGILWALHHLERAGLHGEPSHDYPRLAGQALDSHRAHPERDGPAHSLWMGEAGIALVAWLLAPSAQIESRLAEVVTTEPEPDTVELMWGTPGLLLAADGMLERTGDGRWSEAWAATAARLTHS